MNTGYTCHVIHVAVPILVLLRLKILWYLGFLPKYLFDTFENLQLYFPPFYLGKNITRIFSHVFLFIGVLQLSSYTAQKMKFYI